jgi:glycine dehydrogenase
MDTTSFALRHIGPRPEEQKAMLNTIGVTSIEQLVSETVPSEIRLKKDLDLDKAMSEQEYLEHIYELSQLNKVFKTYIGLGYHPTNLPAVIQRNILENPGWYTAYTPYQAEIAQGRLEALLNFQTMVIDLTGMEISNASLLDESTAAAEAMALLFAVRERDQKKAGVNKLFVSDTILPQTLSLLETRAIPIGIELVIGNETEFDYSNKYFGALLQYPGKDGQITDIKTFIEKANTAQIKVAVAADILSLIKLEAPGKFGADIVVGTTQRFGIPMGYGGPHAAYFATKEAYKRFLPGRIIGVTRDMNGNRALRMALQTREQHIKRDKATSNICTAQVLLAVMAGMYAVYHGPKGLEFIANKVTNSAATLAEALESLGIPQINTHYFDTLQLKANTSNVRSVAEAHNINFYYPDAETVTISLNETTSISDLNEIISIFEEVTGKTTDKITSLLNENTIPEALKRQTDFLTFDVF